MADRFLDACDRDNRGQGCRVCIGRQCAKGGDEVCPRRLGDAGDHVNGMQNVNEFGKCGGAGDRLGFGLARRKGDGRAIGRVRQRDSSEPAVGGLEDGAGAGRGIGGVCVWGAACQEGRTKGSALNDAHSAKSGGLG